MKQNLIKITELPCQVKKIAILAKETLVHPWHLYQNMLWATYFLRPVVVNLWHMCLRWHIWQIHWHMNILQMKFNFLFVTVKKTSFIAYELLQIQLLLHFWINRFKNVLFLWWYATVNKNFLLRIQHVNYFAFLHEFKSLIPWTEFQKTITGIKDKFCVYIKKWQYTSQVKNILHQMYNRKIPLMNY